MSKTKFVIGHYPNINGNKSIPLDNVKPTKDEILQIIRYHVKLLRSIDEIFASGQTGSWEIRQYPYSNQRIYYYSQFVDKSEVDAIFDEVYDGFEEWEKEILNECL